MALEPKIVQSCPASKKTSLFGATVQSIRPKAKRSCSALLRIVETLRLSTALKLPSKSASTCPVTVTFLETSGHSNFEPKRVARAFMCHSGLLLGPVSVAKNHGLGKSSDRKSVV